MQRNIIYKVYTYIKFNYLCDMKCLFLSIFLLANTALPNAGTTYSFWPSVDIVSDYITAKLEVEHNTSKSPQRLSLLINLLDAHAQRTQNRILKGRVLYWKSLTCPIDSSGKLIEEALAATDSTLFPYDYTRIMIQNATIQYYQSEYVQSFITFNNSAPYFMSKGDKRNAAKCYANIGLIFMELKEYEDATLYLLKADSLFSELNATEIGFSLKKDLALCYGNNGKQEKASEILRTIIQNDFSKINNAKLKIAYLFAYCDYLDKPEDEKQYIITAYESAIKERDPELIRIAILNMSWMYFKSGNLTLAEKYANQVYRQVCDIKDDLSLLPLKSNMYHLLSQLYAQKKIWDKAYHFQIAYEACQQLDNKTNAIKHIQNLEIRKEMEKQQFILKQTQLEIKQQQERAIIIRITMVILLAMSGIIIFLLFKRGQTEKRLRNIEKREYTENLVNQQHKVDAKSRELSSNAMLLMKKNEILKKLKYQIDGYKEAGQIEGPTEKEIKNKINEALYESNDWEAFKLQFNEIHPEFFKNLQKYHPELSNNDLRLCAYLKMHLTTKQIAQLISVQPQTVTIARYRMKKKMNLAKDVSLDEYIKQIGGN